MTLLAAAALTLAAADDPRPKTPAGETKPTAAARETKPNADDDREAVALAFVRAHHPELAALLATLKPMRPAEYDRAVRELAQVSRTLDALRARDPSRYELGLDAWKARSRVELLTARLASASSANPELESQLRQAVTAQLDVEVRQQRYEKAQAEQRLRRLEENLRRLESDPDALVQSRYAALLKKSQRARRLAQGDETKPKPARPKSKPAAKAGALAAPVRPEPRPDPTQGDRQP